MPQPNVTKEIAIATEAAPPPRQTISASQLKQNRVDRITTLAEHQDLEHAKFQSSFDKSTSPGVRKFKRLLRITMEAFMRGSWNRHALFKVWSTLMPDYPFTDAGFKCFHVDKGGAASKPYNRIGRTH
jgi:hypothetical protein